MPRPKRCRRICCEPEFSTFEATDSKTEETVILANDEFEVIRLVDYEKKTHEECAQIMGVSRTTITEIYENARHKIADTLVNGKKLLIKGGNYILCDGSAKPFCGNRSCRRTAENQPIQHFLQKGENIMRLAVTYENGEIFQHFGHTATFKFFDIEDGKIISSSLEPTNGSGHGALAGFLSANKVDALICGGIGGGAQTALAEAGIKIYGGVKGSADEAAKSFAAGRLIFNPNVHCDHHDHEHQEGHSCGEHSCSEHSCGNN
ncbi:MAG: DUF134 domain-containing protein [Treponemataceae bacterium]|nr:DUF134 domain-containing protein [Treponemataceae bacterium]